MDWNTSLRSDRIVGRRAVRWMVAIGWLVSMQGQAMGDQRTNGAYATVIDRLSAAIQGEIEKRMLTGVSVALVDDQEVVFARGFGMADEERGIPADADTVYRAGSISKLFNALAVMQLVDEGRLDLDAPIGRYDPDFAVVVPFEDAGPITLRLLLCHRSGMVREAPVGGYFDSSQPGIEATVRSIAPCVLVNPPDTKTRYSNVGPTIAGHIVSLVSGMPYEEYQQRRILGPMAMQRSAFRLTTRLRPLLARGYMAVARTDGTFDRRPAPLFELGTIPAGNLYTSATDLARLAMLIFAEGRAGSEQIVRPEALREMLRPQRTGEPAGFGLGFSVGRFGRHVMVSHNGAVYGFTSSFLALPEAKLAAIVLANDDLVLGPVRMIGETALELMLEARFAEKPPVPTTVPVPRDELLALAGEYESESFWATIRLEGDRLGAVISGQPVTLSPIGPMKFLAAGRYLWRSEFTFEKDSAGTVSGFAALNQRFRRVHPAAILPAPKEWSRFVGSYGPSHIPLIVSIRNGHLYAFTENMLDYRLVPLTRSVFRMPPGLYTDEHLVFQSGPDGVVHTAILANVELRRTR